MNFRTFYEKTMTITTEQYYDQLNKHLKKYGYSLGENNFNPDIGYADPSYKGIYRGSDQIGHIDLRIIKNVLVLEKIKSYANYYNEKFGLLSIIYPFHKNQCLQHNLTIKSQMVNPKTIGYFQKVFSDKFLIKKVGNMTVAIPKYEE